jgi:hypothetical protein
MLFLKLQKNKFRLHALQKWSNLEVSVDFVNFEFWDTLAVPYVRYLAGIFFKETEMIFVILPGVHKKGFPN